MAGCRKNKFRLLGCMFLATYCLSACSHSPDPSHSIASDNAAMSAGVVASPVVAQSSNTSAKKATPMSTQQIITHILEKDWDMVDVPGAIPPDAAPEIVKLLDNSDPEVRELAIYSLNAAGGEAAKDGFLKALNDESEMVRSAACKSLVYNYDPKYLQAYINHLKSDDEFVREHVALVIGKIGGPKAVQAIKERLAVEKDADAKHAMSIALARMKDEQGTKDYVSRLTANDPGERVKALEDYLYIRDRSLLPDVAKLLSDTRDAKNMAPAGHEYFIRVCDVAVNTLDLVLGHPFPFQVDSIKRYSAEELYQAQQIVMQK
jgi:HEAT repeat protein